MSHFYTQTATLSSPRASTQAITCVDGTKDRTPQLFSKVDLYRAAIQPRVLSMRLQQILRFFSRPKAEPVTPSKPPKADVEIDLAPASESARNNRAPDRLELQTAIIHHLEWCVLFNEHLSVDASGHAPLVPLPGVADCGLGQWLNSVRNGSVGNAPGLDALEEEHHHFHRLALKALAFARQDRMDLASTLLNTDFERSRARILELLRKMQKK